MYCELHETRPMSFVAIRKSVGHDWDEMFALVLDLERYPRFVPGCTRVRLLSRHDPGPGIVEIVSRMTVGVPPLQLAYTNITRADRSARRIAVAATDGPLRHLQVLWRFEPRDVGRSEIAFSASYEFRSPILAALAAGAFERLFGQIVDAFERRADWIATAPPSTGGAALADATGAIPSARTPRTSRSG
jgi:coenzyme Q-binding protein COQ10